MSYPEHPGRCSSLVGPIVRYHHGNGSHTGANSGYSKATVTHREEYRCERLNRTILIESERWTLKTVWVPNRLKKRSGSWAESTKSISTNGSMKKQLGISFLGSEWIGHLDPPRIEWKCKVTIGRSMYISDSFNDTPQIDRTDHNCGLQHECSLILKWKPPTVSSRRSMGRLLLLVKRLPLLPR